MAFICGSFHTQEEDDYEVLWPSTPPRKATRRRHVFGSQRCKNTTNPYSDRGLDKFEALLAELDHKRQKILTQKGSEDVSMVKFIYRSPEEVKPIVVKSRDQRKSLLAEAKHEKDDEAEEEQKKKIEWGRRLKEWWKPWNYLALLVMLILVLLMFSGRSFAILCTSLGWYLVPIINQTLHIQNGRRRSPRKITPLKQ